MTRHLEIETDKLKRGLLDIAAVVEEALRLAVRAVVEHDAAVARGVIDSCGVVDRMEVELEEECLKVLALYQPVAGDLRFIVAVLKINSDLERIGDLTENIADRAAALADAVALEIPYDFAGMAEHARRMLRGSLDSLSDLDAARARAVCADDERVDLINRDMYRRIKAAIQARPDRIDALLHLLSASRYVERIADHATNIAEDVIYLLEGGIVRHALRERPDDTPGAPPPPRA